MPNQATSYTDGMFERFGLYAAWPPNVKLRTGDIGILEGKLFHYRSNLETMGIHFDVQPPGSEIDFEHHSGFEGDAVVSGQASATGLVGQGATKLSFDRSGAFLFQATGARGREIVDKLKLANELTRLYREHIWDPSRCVIESLYEVERATIVVANSDEGHVGISAEAGFPNGAVPLAKAQGTLAVTSRSGNSSTFLGQQGLTPLFKLLWVKRTWIQIIMDALRKGAPVPVPVREEDVLGWPGDEIPQ